MDEQEFSLEILKELVGSGAKTKANQLFILDNIDDVQTLAGEVGEKLRDYITDDLKIVLPKITEAQKIQKARNERELATGESAYFRGRSDR